MLPDVNKEKALSLILRFSVRGRPWVGLFGTTYWYLACLNLMSLGSFTTHSIVKFYCCIYKGFEIIKLSQGQTITKTRSK